MPGPRNVKIYNTQNNELLLEIPNVEVPSEQILTSAIYGGTSSLKFLQIIDDVNIRIAPDETRIRFYNLDSIPITFTITPTIGLQDKFLQSGQGTEYYNVPPGDYNIQISWSNQTPNQKSKNVSIRFNPGRIYTLYFINSINPDDLSYSVANIPQIVLMVDGNTLYDKCNLLY